MQVPKPLTDSLCNINGFKLQDFCNAHLTKPDYRSIRIHPHKSAPLPFDCISPIPWTKQGFYVSSDITFTTDPNFHSGAYYVQEPSSMFIEYLIVQLQLHLKPIKALDLCAAPGGKTTILLDLLPLDSLIWANEPHPTRALTLSDTLNRWGYHNVCVSNTNAKTLNNSLQFKFNLTLVDAPCSGSGLFRKQPQFSNEWHLGLVKEARKTQESILHEAYQITENQGFIIYSTCSFSPEENELLTTWFLSHYPVKQVQVDVPEAWNIKVSEGGYRFWPHLLKGEGFYCTVFQVLGHTTHHSVKIKKSLFHTCISKPQLPFEIFTNDIESDFITYKNALWCISKSLLKELKNIDNQLNIIKIGACCTFLNTTSVPDHQLAQSNFIKTHFPQFECNLNWAINYLKRNSFKNTYTKKGWHLITYNNLGMGWANFLINRINNAYPKILKILH